MQRPRSWPGLAALALASLALLISLGALVSAWWPRPPAFVGQMPPDTFARPGPGSGRFFDEGRPPPDAPPPFAPPWGKYHIEGHRFDRHPGGFFWPWLGAGFKLLQALTQLTALALVAWLLLRLFQQGHGSQPPADPPAPAGPTTPAGHDPRIE
ncbi:MAG: hypothetical protein ACUVS4_04975 [Chloroflexaceae bacterium]